MVIMLTPPRIVPRPLMARPTTHMLPPHSILDQARHRARTLGLGGAAFPWRTIHGEECSAYWPAGTAALHLNAVIARAVDEVAGRAGETLRESMRRASVDATRPDVEMWLVVGLPNLSLLQAAGNADLLVVGSRGYGGWKELLMGSVSAQCVTQSPCPVAVVHDCDGDLGAVRSP